MEVVGVIIIDIGGEFICQGVLDVNFDEEFEWVVFVVEVLWV